MSYFIEQSSDYKGDKRWNWQAWIEASPVELEAVADVIWYLHDSFTSPVVRKTKSKNNFQLSRTGWGVFLLHAEVNLKNGETIHLKHQLSFVETDTHQHAPLKAMRPPGSPETKQARIFLSYGAEDSELAEKVQKNLQGFGYQVQDINDCELGMPAKLAQQKLMRESDVIMGLVTSDVTSPYVLDDLNRAKQADKAAIALVGDKIKPLGLDPELQKMSLSATDDQSLQKLFKQLDKF
ncbi:MAG: hypothetical protein GQ582_09700 [Methyloprofundus sp.]|nr:hypothetical protein [Methyloprofundus sp.]